MLAVGVGLVLVPIVLQGSQMAAGLKQLPYIGAIAIAVGLVMLWLERTGQPQIVKSSHLSSKVVSIGKTRAERAHADKSNSEVTPARPDQWGPDVLGLIEWRRLEAVVEALFKQAGFETKAQSHGADGGVDIWLYSKHKPGEVASIVQCKHWTAKVGVDKVREFRGVMAAHQVERGQFVGTNGFTPEAQAFASANGINLLDRDKLLGLISRRQPHEQTDLLGIALAGEFWKPTCASCGVKMIRRSSSRIGREFWGCVKYPACKNTL